MSKASFAVSVVNAKVASINHSKSRLIEELKDLKARSKGLKPFLNKFSYLKGLENASCRLEVWSDSTSVYITLRRLEGFKDELLTRSIIAVNDYAMDNGYKVFVYNSEDASFMNRDYRFVLSKTDDRYDSNLDITIFAYVKSDSPTCRKVQIGETVEIVPKYEIVCD
jgi:hypothetical protein